jgi:hypothetical protein
MGKLLLIEGNEDLESRLLHRIRNFEELLNKGDGDVAMCEELVLIIYNYLIQFEDFDVHYAAVKLKEVLLLLNNFQEEKFSF